MPHAPRKMRDRTVLAIFDGEEFVIACLLWLLAGFCIVAYQAARLTGTITGGSRINWFLAHSGGGLPGGTYAGSHLYWVATYHSLLPILTIAVLTWLAKAAWEVIAHPIR